MARQKIFSGYFDISFYSKEKVCVRPKYFNQFPFIKILTLSSAGFNVRN